MKKVFVSYSGEDREKATELVDALRNEEDKRTKDCRVHNLFSLKILFNMSLNHPGEVKFNRPTDK
jgi:hypothetical protein